MSHFGKRLMFIAFGLALLCLVPMGLHQLFGPEDGKAVIPGLIMLIGFPLFATLTFLGMVIWGVGIVRDEERQRDKSSPN